MSRCPPPWCRVISVAVVLCFSALSACEAAVEPGRNGPQALEVSAVSPSPQSLSAPPTTDLTMTFDRPIDPSTFDDRTLYVYGRWSGIMPGTLTLEGDGAVARFSPARAFAPGEWVTVTVPSAVSGTDGRSLAGGYTWNFWIRAGAGSLDFVSGDPLPLREEGEAQIQSYGAYAGDFDGDGFSDLMIPNERPADVRVLLNDGAGGYGDFVIYPIPGGAFPSTNEGADFNRDGIIDLAVGNSGNRLVSLFNGRGAGTFEFAGNVEADSGVRGLCVLDLNGDGAPDVVTANRDGGRGTGNVSLLLNDGTGALAPAETLDPGGTGETSCAAADANEDGILDVFVGSLQSREVTLLLGDGEGGLRVGPTVDAGGGPWMVAAGDMNGDGHVDVVSANAGQGSFSLIAGDGRGGIERAATFPVGQTPLAIDVADLDGDGDLDVVTSNFDSADFTVYENLGGGAFGNPRTLAAASAGSCATLHDRDNDGDLDISGIDETDDLLFLFVNPG